MPVRGKIASKFLNPGKDLDAFLACAESPILGEPLVFVGCLEITQLLVRAMKKSTFTPKAYCGIVKAKTIPDKKIAHCWVEEGDKVIETNPSQILGSKDTLTKMKKDDWIRLTEPESIVPFERDHLSIPTPAGEKYYNSLAENVALCFNRRKRGLWVGP